MKAGTLYLVATPIGNLEDITLRALRVLREADLVACEDTRRARVLLQRHGIRVKLISYYGAKEKEGARRLLEHLVEGKSVALISDAGMPGISDPGSVIVGEALQKGIDVVPVPGPSAGVTALAASGLSSERFVFEGFLPRKASERRTRLMELMDEGRTMIFHESPRRLRQTLADMRAVMGDREAVVVREMTKLYEEFIRGTLDEICKKIGRADVRGEIVVLLAGSKGGIDWEKVDIPAYIKKIQEELGIDKKSAIKLVAQLSGLAKSVIYKETL